MLLALCKNFTSNPMQVEPIDMTAGQMDFSWNQVHIHTPCLMQPIMHL